MNISKELKQQFKAITGKDSYFDNPEELIVYSYDATNFSHKPDIVLFPVSVEQVSGIMKLANDNNVYVHPRGAGTNLSGGSIPFKGGIALVLTKMNKILGIDRDNLTAVVEPGVITEEFKKEVDELGLFYPPDPASMASCTMGGNIAENAGGPHCLKYGVTRDYVLDLEVVLHDGEVINTGAPTIKNVTGYDLTRLFIGSEGTLGIVTKITLKLIPKPSNRVVVMAVFNKTEEAGRSVSKILSAGVLPAAVEFMDNACINCVEDYLKIGLPVDKDALVLFEFDTDDASFCAEKVVGICEELGAVRLETRDDEDGCEELFKARRAVSPALGRISPHKIMEDIVVPRSKLPSFLSFVKELSSQVETRIACFGHAGDGNIHVNVLIKDRGEAELKKGKYILTEIFKEVMSLKGVVSGEHGIGYLKMDYLEENVGSSYKYMKKIKDIFDPKGILNPGKVFT
ncbi:MAG: FAD-linked oxidase C-terminal domain-containing protein [Armatimonadota bacterium]